jgi:hypothetical protein
MAPEIDLDKLHDMLHPARIGLSHTVWCVLDAAMDEQIFPLVRDSGLDYQCLYSGHLPRELKWVAPYLVELPRDNETARNLIRRSWGKSWGIFLWVTDYTNLRPHLRKFLRVQDESKQSLLFRYYDPRVLREFLPTCDAEQLKLFFGPIDRFWVEGNQPSIARSFGFRSGELIEWDGEVSSGHGQVASSWPHPSESMAVEGLQQTGETT